MVVNWECRDPTHHPGFYSVWQYEATRLWPAWSFLT